MYLKNFLIKVTWYEGIGSLQVGRFLFCIVLFLLATPFTIWRQNDKKCKKKTRQKSLKIYVISLFFGRWFFFYGLAENYSFLADSRLYTVLRKKKSINRESKIDETFSWSWLTTYQQHYCWTQIAASDPFWRSLAAVVLVF